MTMRTLFFYSLAGFCVLVGVALANDYYTHGSFPSPGSSLSSASMRAELDTISAGFDKLPPLTGNGGKAVVINGSGTALGVTTGTLTLTGNFSVSGAFATTLTATGSTNVTLPTSGTLATLAGAEVLTNKTLNLTSNTLTGTTAQFNSALSDNDFATLAGVETLTNKTITSLSNTGTITIPSGTTDTLVARATTDTLTNKSVDLANNTVTGTTAQFNTALSDNDFATLAGAETLTNKTITALSNTGTITIPSGTDTLVARDTTDTLTNKTVNLTSNTLSGTTAQFNTALSDGDFATLAGSETLTNKTITALSNTGTITIPSGTTDTLVGRATTDTLTNKTLSGAVVSAAPTTALGVANKTYVEEKHVNPILNGNFLVTQSVGNDSVDIGFTNGWTPGNSHPGIRYDFWKGRKVTTTAGVEFQNGGFVNAGLAASDIPSMNALAVNIQAPNDTSVDAGDLIYVTTFSDPLHDDDFIGSDATISFSVKSNVTGTYHFGAKMVGTGNTLLFSYSIDSANTWEEKTFVIPYSTSPNGWFKGAHLFWTLMAGSTYQGTADIGWQSAVTNLMATSSQVNFAATTNNKFYLTAVRVQKGNLSRAMVRWRDFHEELQIAKRYYQKYGNEYEYQEYTSGSELQPVCFGAQGTGAINQVHAVFFEIELFPDSFSPTIYYLNACNGCNVVIWNETDGVAGGTPSIVRNTNKSLTTQGTGNAGMSPGERMCYNFAVTADIWDSSGINGLPGEH